MKNIAWLLAIAFTLGQAGPAVGQAVAPTAVFPAMSAFGEAAASPVQVQVNRTVAAKPGSEIPIPNAPVPMRILVQSPAETNTGLQIICLFRSDASNTLHGSLVEADEKLKGLLDQIRKPTLFRGELGETLLIDPPAGTLAAKQLLIIGLGDSQTFTPERMELVGSIVYREANRLGASQPFFAPTLLDGGVTKFGTGEVAEQVISGFLRAMHTEKIIKAAGASRGPAIENLTFLAGPSHAVDTEQGIEKAIAADARR